MKKLFILAVVSGAVIQLCAASKVACRNCGVRDNNVIIQCAKRHMTCTSCARGRTAAESFQDAFAAQLGFGGSSAQRCTYVNRFDEVCNADIVRKIADNRSPETIRRENENARKQAAQKAAAKERAAQEKQAKINALETEHNTLVKNLPVALRSNSMALIRKHANLMINHFNRHNGFGGSVGFFGIGGKSGESCNILNHMLNAALRSKSDAVAEILLANIDPSMDSVIAGFKTGRPVYTRLFAHKLIVLENFNAAVDTLVETHCKFKNPAYIAPVIQKLKNEKFSDSNGHARWNQPKGMKSTGNKQTDERIQREHLFALFHHFVTREKAPSFEALKPFYDAFSAADLNSILPEMIIRNDVKSYRYLIDQKKVAGTATVNKDGLVLYPYHLLLAKSDFTYAKKVEYTPQAFCETIKLTKEGQQKKDNKYDKELTPVEYMAAVNNFEAVKFLIEKEGYEFGTFSTHSASTSAVNFAKKNRNKEMEKYLDDKISGWTTAGVIASHVLLLPVYILVLLVAR